MKNLARTCYSILVVLILISCKKENIEDTDLPHQEEDKIITFRGSDDILYTLSLIQPAAPKIGINDLEVQIDKKGSGNNVSPVKDLTLAFTPRMPHMGNHSSPNNVDPVHSNDGRYKGKVNFTMSGDWRLHFTIKRGDEVLAEDVALDLLF